mmetsp:Transcript_2292/g.4391  ORF Transcript_2292/g.4391 Transcript_2292/m.4391 type:complete len:217 (+) Transcript_2292:164-814(+)
MCAVSTAIRRSFTCSVLGTTRSSLFSNTRAAFGTTPSLPISSTCHRENSNHHIVSNHGSISVLLASSKPPLQDTFIPCLVTTTNITIFKPRHFSSNTAEATQTKTYQELHHALSPSRQKLITILHDYKLKNYSQSVPSRFIKAVISALDANHDELITFDEYQVLLRNIGAEGKMTKDEMWEVFEEIGVISKDDEEKVIPVQTLVECWSDLFKAPEK